MRLISACTALKKGRVRSSSSFALRILAEAMRYIACVIFCVSRTLSMRDLISLSPAIYASLRAFLSARN